MKRILVPTDFSEQANNALKVAAQLAEKYDCDLYLMHMLELPGASTNIIEDGDQPPEAMFYMRGAHKRFEQLLRQDYLKDIRIQETVEFHGAFDGIIDGVDKYDIDLIVMGSNGASGMQEVFIGSNTEKVVRHSKIPVLVIKEEIEDFRVDSFVFATDFTPKGKDAFWRALDFSKSLEAHMHLVYINTPHKFKTTEEMDDKMNEFTKDAPTDNFSFTVFNDSTIEKGIINYTKQIQAELTGIATNGRRGLAHLLNGSISEDLVNHTTSPIVTFRVEV